jgi:hypothetical protein
MWLFGILSAWADTEPTTSNEDTDSSEVVEEATEDTIATPEETNPTDTSSESEQETPESTVPPPESETSSEDTPADDADELNEEEALQMLEEILSASLENMEDLEIPETTEEDDEEVYFVNYKGNLYYAYQIHRWKSPSTHTLFSGGIAGDPQYYFQHGNRWGTTLGLRFQLSAAENLNTTYHNNFIGLTGGVQFGALRLNTAMSWFGERYFIEEEIAKDVDFITYRYSELPQMSGLLWEQTLTYAPDGQDFGLQLTVGLPFQVNGTRDMGETIGEAFSISSKLNISFMHLGYQYTQYPGQSVQMAELGSGILF